MTASAADRLAACEVLTGVAIHDGELLLASTRGDVLQRPPTQMVAPSVAQCDATGWKHLGTSPLPAWSGLRRIDGEPWLLGHQQAIYQLSSSAEVTLRHRQKSSSQVVMDLLATSDDRHYAVGSGGLYLVSDDGGQHWSPQDLYIDPEWDEPEDFSLNAIAQLSSGELVVAGELGSIYWSDDGDDWHKDDAEFESTWFGALALNDGAVLLFGFGGKVAYSDGYRRSWRALETPAAESLFAAVETERGWLLAGANGALLAFDKAALSLTQLSSGTDATITGLLVHNGYLLMSTDRGLRSVPFNDAVPSQ
jgi:photosystem II stability/assembly factor-like uncharacterized protein